MIKRETLSSSSSASRVRSSILNLKGSAPAHLLKSTSFWGSLRPHVITEQIEPPRNIACGHSRVMRCRDEMYWHAHARMAVCSNGAQLTARVDRRLTCMPGSWIKSAQKTYSGHLHRGTQSEELIRSNKYAPRGRGRGLEIAPVYACIGDVSLLLHPPYELRRRRIRGWQEWRLRFVVNTGCIRDTIFLSLVDGDEEVQEDDDAEKRVRKSQKRAVTARRRLCTRTSSMITRRLNDQH